MDRQAWTRWRPTVRQRWWLAGGAAFVLVVALTWALWPASEPDPPPRAREYLDYTACLLTGDRGIADPQAAPVWAGLQDASLATRAKVQYLAVTGPQTAENGVPGDCRVAEHTAVPSATSGTARPSAKSAASSRFKAYRRIA